MHITITSQGINISPGSEVILRHQTWLDYEELLNSRPDQAAIRVSFDAKTQEIRIMSPLAGHGKKSDTLSDLVKSLLRHQKQDWESFHAITLKRFQQKGLEPDVCFYTQNREAILGKERIDLAIDPSPDLAIEIDITSITHPEDYQEINVPELWIYREKTLYIYLFDGQQYQEVFASPTFPNIPVKQLIPEYVEKAWAIGSSIALREFEEYLKA